MKGKRTNWDFSNYEVKSEIVNGELGTTRISEIKLKDSGLGRVRFTTTDGVMMVTGDFYNWVFNAGFHPSAKDSANDGYFIQKLELKNLGEFKVYSEEETYEKIRYLMEEWEDEGQACTDSLAELMSSSEDESSLTAEFYAQVHELGDLCLSDIIGYEYPKQLDIIFDAFDEICNRLKS